MDSKDEENRIAMRLARRAYLYGMFHVVFGGGVNEVMREMIAASGLKVPRVPR